MQTVSIIESNLTHRNRQVNRFAATSGVSRLRCVMNGDKVTFSGASEKPDGLTEAQKLERVEAKAKAIFEKGKNSIPDLIQAFKEAYPDVAIFYSKQDGQQWVDDACRIYGSLAFVHFPDSVKYGTDPEKIPDFLKDDPEEESKIQVPSPFPFWMRGIHTLLSKIIPGSQPTEEDLSKSEFLTKVLPDLYRNKQPALFIGKDADRYGLIHEMYHMIQFKEGLPFGVNPPNMEADTAAKVFNHEYLRPKTGIAPLDTALMALAWAWSWLVQVPATMAQKAMGIIKPRPDSPGAALRAEMHREQEVDSFIVRNGGKYGIPWYCRLDAATHLLMEGKLKEYLSYRLD